MAASVFLTTFAASVTVAYTVRAAEPEAVVSIRRTFSLIFASNILWFIPIALGSAAYIVRHNSQPSINEFVVGGFLAWSFQLLVINGAFIPSTAKSICIAALQPLATMLLVTGSVPVGPAITYASSSGIVILIMVLTFLLKFKTFKTEGEGINSLQTFQSFLKSWVSQRPADLESYFTLYSRDEPVATRIVLAEGTEKVALVLPGVHPGPFAPVGSYDLSELIYHALRKNGTIPMVLHGVGGHERNLPTNELAKQYAATIASIAASSAGQRLVKIRGPLSVKIGLTSVTTIGFGDRIMALLSNAPYTTDDLDPKTIGVATSIATAHGAELMLVDAHNSIGDGGLAQPALAMDDWENVISGINSSPEEDFLVGAAHSSEIQFDHGSDISDGGLGVLVFKKRESTHALVTADSNNAVSGLREMVVDALKSEGVDLIELCTSDTHKSAARNLTDRGYRALGEDSDKDALVAAVVELGKMAQRRLSKGSLTVISSHLTLPLIGDRALNDFANLTKRTLSFSKSYAYVAVASTIAICFAALSF
jgi:putative membrane protein